jgi:hypothetical protein
MSHHILFYIHRGGGGGWRRVGVEEAWVKEHLLLKVRIIIMELWKRNVHCEFSISRRIEVESIKLVATLKYLSHCSLCLHGGLVEQTMRRAVDDARTEGIGWLGWHLSWAFVFRASSFLTFFFCSKKIGITEEEVLERLSRLCIASAQVYG